MKVTLQASGRPVQTMQKLTGAAAQTLVHLVAVRCGPVRAYRPLAMQVLNGRRAGVADALAFVDVVEGYEQRKTGGLPCSPGES